MHHDVKISVARSLGFEPMTYGSESECATYYTTVPQVGSVFGNQAFIIRCESLHVINHFFDGYVCSLFEVLYTRLEPELLNSL